MPETPAPASSSGSSVQHQIPPSVSSTTLVDLQEAKVSTAAKAALSGGIGVIAGTAVWGITVLVIGLSLTGVGIAIAAAVIATIATAILLHKKRVEQPKEPEETSAATITAAPEYTIERDPELQEAWIRFTESHYEALGCFDALSKKSSKKTDEEFIKAKEIFKAKIQKCVDYGEAYQFLLEKSKTSEVRSKLLSEEITKVQAKMDLIKITINTLNP